MILSTFVIPLFVTISQAIAIPRDASNTSSIPAYLSRVVYQFPKSVWLENIATLRNGSLITGTLGSTAELYLIHPTTNTASLVHNFTDSGYNTIAGIAELQDDVWVIVTSNYTSAGGPERGSAALWKVDLSGTQYGSDVEVEKVINLPDTGLPNGLATVNNDTILFTDSFVGNIGRVTLEANGTATYDAAIESPNLAFNETAPLGLGANGLKYRAPFLYWTQSWSGRVVRAPISPTTGLRTGEDEILATEQYIMDDLEISPDEKTLYIVRPYAKTLISIALPEDGGKAGEPEVILGGEGSTVVPGGTAETFGRTSKDGNVLYVSTSGGLTGENGEGETLEGGKVVAVYLDEKDAC